MDLNEARDDGVFEWQWHQLDRMQTICTSHSRQITTPTHHQSISTGWMLFLMPNQQCQSTERQVPASCEVYGICVIASDVAVQSQYRSNYCYYWLFLCLDLEWSLMKIIITVIFCCDNLWRSKFTALEKPGKLGEFSSTLWPPSVLRCCWLGGRKGIRPAKNPSSPEQRAI